MNNFFKHHKDIFLVGCGILALVAAAFFTFSPLKDSRATENSTPIGKQRSTSTIKKTNQESLLADDKSEADTEMKKSIRMRWNGEAWEYSTDGGESWTQTPPDGVSVDDKNNVSLWEGEGKPEDFDVEEFMEEVEEYVDGIQSEIKEKYGELMPEDGKGSFFSSGDSIARQVDGKWEYSTDGGKTWSDEPFDGFEVDEDGTRFKMKGDKENSIEQEEQTIKPTTQI